MKTGGFFDKNTLCIIIFILESLKRLQIFFLGKKKKVKKRKRFIKVLKMRIFENVFKPQYF